MRALLPLLLCVLATCDTAIMPSEAEPEVERSYTKTITRQVGNDFEADLIAQAEAAYPPRDSVLAAVWPPEARDHIPETGYWYYDAFDGTLIPYAITGEAVAYYGARIDSMQAHDGYDFFFRAHFDYEAGVTFVDAYTFEREDPFTGQPLGSVSFERVYVVEMKLGWDQYCGMMCAMSIRRERVVVFGEDGALLAVFLDGPIPIMVS